MRRAARSDCSRRRGRVVNRTSLENSEALDSHIVVEIRGCLLKATVACLALPFPLVPEGRLQGGLSTGLSVLLA